MRGQLVGIVTGTGRMLLTLLFIFVILGAIIGAGLIDSNNPFYSIWQKAINYSGVVFTIAVIGLLFLLWKFLQAYL